MPCSAPALKRAFLFSCLTALRKSDIKKLTWEEIQPYGNDGVMYVIIWILNHMIIAALENCYYHQPHDFSNRKNERIGRPVFQ